MPYTSQRLESEIRARRAYSRERLIVPGAITLIPAFLLLRDLKLLNTYHAIWWPVAAFVLGIFLMRQHFYAIPRDLEDAARVDGAGPFRIYRQVCLPLVRGAMVALVIFTFLGMWNDLFDRHGRSINSAGALPAL